MNLPILFHHDPTKVLGVFMYDVIEHRHFVVFDHFAVTREMFFAAQINWSFIIIEEEERDGIVYMRKIELLEISL